MRNRKPVVLGVLKVIAGFLVCILANGIARAQVTAAPEPPPACKYILDNLLPPGNPDLEKQILTFIDVGVSANCIWQVAFKDQSLGSAIRAAYKAETKSNSIQTGATAGAAGTTSAISKPATPLSLATEYGGITSSTSNQTVTFQAPLDGIPRALATHGDLPYCSTTLITFKNCLGGGLLGDLNRIGLGLSMNTSTPSNTLTASATGASQGSAQAVSTTSQGSKGPSFAGASVKIELIKPSWKLPPASAVNGATEQIAALSQLESILKTNKRYTTWQNCVLDKLQHAPAVQRYQVFAKYYTQIKQVLLFGMEPDCSDSSSPPIPHPQSAAAATDPSEQKVISAIQAYVATSMLTQASFDAQVLASASSPILSFEYDYATPQNQQSNSTYKLVGSHSWPAPPKNANATATTAPWTATFNVGASLYNSSPSSSVPQASTLRALQAGAQLDRVIASSKWPGWLGKIGDSTASLTYYYQDLTSPSILKVTPGSPLSGITLVGLPSTATTIFTQKGNMHIAQFKYGLGTGKNVKFPIAVTYATRTELIVHPAWGVQFGISYDFTSLLPTGSTAAGNQQ